MGEGSVFTARLDDADENVTVRLPDGSEVEIYGDGMVYVYRSSYTKDPTRKINLYLTEGEEVSA